VTRLPLRAVIAAAAVLLSTASTRELGAQSSGNAVVLWRAGRALALRGQVDSALRTLELAGAAARTAGDQATEFATRRGRADLWMLRGCADSATRILREAVAAASPGDRSSADALVRLLASRGAVADARRALVKAYGDIPSVGSIITRESVTFLQGMAAVELAGGQESAALSALNSALAIAVRLHEGDVNDRSEHAIGEITDENAWLLFDLAELRRTARSPAIRSPREHARLMANLVKGWPTLDVLPDSGVPITRFADRLVMRTALCAADGSECPAPIVAKGCP
jgi:tetratricopeptide (TPR) repeat protein